MPKLLILLHHGGEGIPNAVNQEITVGYRRNRISLLAVNPSDW
jgi:hypothetical protein